MKNSKGNRLIITHNNRSFTDDARLASSDVALVVSKHNETYRSQAIENGCKDFIQSADLIKHFDFSSIKIIGITGTNGKTTTAATIYSILLDLGYKVALQGTRGFFINDDKVEEYSLTTPVQLGNFDHIIKAINEDCEYFVMEVSSHAIEQNRIEGLQFALKVHTNITQDHLDYHKTLQNYIDTKNSFFQDQSMKLINKDDPYIKYNIKNCFAYGVENPATYKISAYSLKNGIHGVIQHFSNMANFSSPLVGLFNIYNITAAIGAVNLVTKKPLQEICNAVENFAGVAGRMEVVSDIPYVVVDFAHTPDGMLKVFHTFNDYDIICVFGAGGNRDKQKRPLMGKVASQHCKELILTSDNPRFEDPQLIVDDIVSGIETHFTNFTIELNRAQGIKNGISKTKNYKNPVVLILGKGDEEFQIIYDKKLQFNDKIIVQTLLGI
ncbi:MAG: UDP-N-acetylmuramoyl-L-alanyl-D-glutamate--2,6-diaminopimelate ligase [Campylobacterales bacterium]|nr:UDP-N-acetylmuramoyl-L-alanyl-D-glutamate--2,6-diaminopimelate ligase [Campylobacterales bacterium]